MCHGMASATVAIAGAIHSPGNAIAGAAEHQIVLVVEGQVSTDGVLQNAA